MAAAPSCTLTPEAPNGEASKLYQELSKKIKDRPLTNLIYASYLVNGVAAQMDAAGKRRNKQGEHKALDVYNYFDVKSIQYDVLDVIKARENLSSDPSIMELDIHGNPTNNIKNVEEALNKCKDFNDNHVGLIASVIQQGDKFRFLVDVRDANTINRIDRTKNALDTWDILKNVMSNIGVDLNNLIQDPIIKNYINPTNALDATQYLDAVSKTRNDILTSGDIRILLATNPSYTGVQRIISSSRWGNGSLDTAVQRVKDVLNNPSAYNSTDVSMANSILDACKNNLTRMNIPSVTNAMNNTIGSNAASSTTKSIEVKLEELNRKYGISAKEYIDNGGKIDSLLKVAQRAIRTLNAEKAKLSKNATANKAEIEEINKTLKNLSNALKGGKFYIGCLNVLKQANDKISTLDDLMKKVDISSNSLSAIHNNAAALLEVNDIMSGYYELVQSLTNIDDLISSENISDYDRQQLKTQAEIILKEFERATKKYDEYSTSVMGDYYKQVLGNTTDFNIKNLLAMTEADAHKWEMLYSIASMDNPILSTLGKIIRDAQDTRDAKMNEVARQIRIATDKLYSSGLDSSFMYEKNGYNIISDIDWDSYNADRKAAIADAKKRGLRDLDLKIALDAWEEAHTEDRVVNKKDGRTERVPNSSYRKSFPSLNAAQQEYYDTMMQLKGEIGSLLPEYAQKQYLAPQVRQGTLDTLAQGDIGRAVKNAAIDKFTLKIREDDTNFWKNGIIDGEEYGVSQSGLDGTPLRQVPIFYINKLADGKDVLRNFSTGLAKLAGVAINYDAMSGIREDAEFIQNYVSTRITQNAAVDGRNQTARFIDNGVVIWSRLAEKVGNSELEGLIAAIIESQILGIKSKERKEVAELVGKITGYTSVKGLTLNFVGMATNTTGAMVHTIIEAGGGEFYGFKDLGWAYSKLLGDVTIGSVGHLYDFITGNRQSYDTLVLELFDFKPGHFNEEKNKEYHKSIWRKVLGLDFLFGGYGIGEYIVHKLNAYAMLHGKKVLVDGRKTCLYKAFRKEGDASNPKLVLKDNVTDLNGNPITWEYIEKYRKLVRGVAQDINGAMTEEDKGTIHLYAAGKLVMNFRQWAPNTYGRRFRGTHYDANFEGQRTGYKVTMLKFAWGLIKDLAYTRAEIAAHWNDLKPYEKANVKKYFTGITLVLLSNLMCSTLGIDDDKKKQRQMSWVQKFLYLVFKRTRSELIATDWLPGALENLDVMINSPVPGSNTVKGLLYPFTHLEDINETTGRGRNKENLYWKNIKRYTLPFYKDIKYYDELEENYGSILKMFEDNYQNKR